MCTARRPRMWGRSSERGGVWRDSRARDGKYGVLAFFVCGVAMYRCPLRVASCCYLRVNDVYYGTGRTHIALLRCTTTPMHEQH